MKKIILIVLMVVTIGTPCFAGEVDPGGIFSVEGTLWDMCAIGFQNGPPFFFIAGCGGQIGFYPGEGTPYVDLGVVSIAYDIFPPAEGRWFRENWFIFSAIMQPAIGLGVFTGCESYGGGRSCLIGIMYKTDDNWLPPNFSLSINPNSGYQGTTLTNAHLYANNTTFQDNPPVQISTEPPDGLAVSNINVISNTEIEFDLDIAIDAPAGLKNVIVTYYYGTYHRRGTAEFEVLEKPL